MEIFLHNDGRLTEHCSTITVKVERSTVWKFCKDSYA